MLAMSADSHASGHHHHHHDHGHVHIDEAQWRAWAAQAEEEGRVLIDFVTRAAAWIAEARGADTSTVNRILDIGSGPGIGTSELARLFPNATLIAVDSSPAMLERATEIAATHGLSDRIATRLAELPSGLDGLEPADVIWASMSLHHVGDEVAALRALHPLLTKGGIIAIAERSGSTTMLPKELGFGTPGFAERLDAASESWFAAMRAGLDHSVPSVDLPTMLATAGYEVIGTRIDTVHLDPPISAAARGFASGILRRSLDQLSGSLSPDDLATFAVLLDPNDPRGVMQRDDVFVDASREVVLARHA